MNDAQAMALALELAERGRYSTQPNPRVGCVLLRNGELIGSGYHLRAGEGHAEINALRSIDNGDAAGATVYVTLEPCSHTGRTPPCADALIKAEVARVVIAMVDPNPLVAGKGIERLRAAGITVDVGLMNDAARALNPGYIKRMETGLPWVRVKLAMSMDGRTAMASGESQWITGAAARSDVQRLRAQSCAIVSGINTVRMDDAALSVRADELGFAPELANSVAQRQPLRVVLDSTLQLSPQAKILSQPGRTLVVAASENAATQAKLEAAGAEVRYLPSANGQVDLRQLLTLLAERQCNEVLVEAGATLAGAMVAAGLVDYFSIFMAPTFLGSAARPLLELPLTKMAEQQRLHIDSVTAVGTDWRIDARPLAAHHN